MALDQLLKKEKELRNQLSMHNKGVESSLTTEKDRRAWQRFQQDENYMAAIERKMLTNEAALTDLEAMMAIKIQIENEIEMNHQQILRLQANSSLQTAAKDTGSGDMIATQIPKTVNLLKNNMLKNGPIQTLKSGPVPLEKENFEIQNQDEILHYRKTAIPKTFGTANGKEIDVHHFTPQEYGSSSCWAITMQNMLAAAGIAMDYHEILKYVPKLQKEAPAYGVSEKRLDEILKDPYGVQSIHDMRGLFFEILGNQYKLEEFNPFITTDITKKDFENKDGGKMSQRETMQAEASSFIKKSIDAGAPVSCIFSGHYITIRGYSFDTNQKMTLHVINSSGTADGRCEETMDMDLFMDRLWSSHQVELSSLRK